MRKYYWILVSVMISEVIIISLNVFIINKYILQSNNYSGANIIETGKNRKNINIQIEKLINLVESSQKTTEKNIAKLNSQLLASIEFFFNSRRKQNLNLLKDIITRETYLILNSYRDGSTHADNFENINIESDNLIQQLLSEGFTKYNNGEFTKSLGIYKKILDINTSNTEALCYYNASLFYQNPGDGSNYYSMKKDLVPLLEAGNLPVEMEKTILNLFIGINMEEGNSYQSEKYME